jgi:hypothetical protein
MQYLIRATTTRVAMKKANLVLRAALAAAGLIGMVGTTMAPVSALAADKPAAAPKISPKVAKPLKAAQDAIQAKDWATANAALAEANAIPDKTPYEQYMTNELAWYVMLQEKKYPEAAVLLEKQLASGLIPEADLPARTKAMTQLSYQNKEYAKAIDYGNKYLALVPNDTDIGVLVATGYYMQNDYAGARTAAQKLIAANPKPTEQMLQLQLSSSVELNDRPGVMKSLEDMLRFYPQQKYWEDLLNQHLFLQNSERDLRTLFRLMNDTGTLTKGEEYTEAASVLIAGGFPTEAQKLLERGMSENAFAGETQSRAKTDLERAKSGAEADRKELPGAAAALAAAKTANQKVATGKLYFSVGDYANAAKAVQAGLTQGGVTDTDDANALLGVALARSGDSAGAVRAFDSVKDARLSEISRLWKLYIETQSGGAVAATPATPAPEPAQ